MDPHEHALVRAEQAAQLKANPLFSKAFADTRAGIMEAWAALDKADERAAELHRMIRCMEKVQRCIDHHIDTGKLARVEIEGRARWFNKRLA